MQPVLTLDFVSDISCPWCAIGLSTLLTALERLPPELAVALQCQPFELVPDAPPGGQDLGELLAQRYGSTPEQQAKAYAMLRQRGAEVGFEFHPDPRPKVYNTLNAHRLLHWAGLEHPERELALKLALLQACHRDQLPLDADDVLLAAVDSAGLDRERAIEILASDTFAHEVRQEEALYQQAGVRSVPTLVVNQRFVIAGSQPPEVLEQALRQIASEATPPANTVH